MNDGQFKRKAVLAFSAAALAGGILAVSSTAALAGSDHGNGHSKHESGKYQGNGYGHSSKSGKGHSGKHGKGHDKKHGKGHSHHGKGHGYGHHHDHDDDDDQNNGAKVDVCHLKGNGSYKVINVSENAVAAHIAHGDPEEWTDLGGNSCEPYEEPPVPSDPVNYCVIITTDSLAAELAPLFPTKTQVTYDPADGTIIDITGPANLDSHSVIGSTPANGIVASLIADSVSVTLDVERLGQTYPNLMGEAVSTSASGGTATYSMSYIAEAISNDEETEGEILLFNGSASMTISESLEACLTTE